MGKASRRDFLAATAASGVALGMGHGVAATPQDGSASRPDNTQPKAEPEIYKGTAAGAVVAQLRAAGVRTLFHTNTSGFVPFWEAIYAAGDVQVINMTHEGQAVAAAAGYTMASRNLGFFFGSHVGIPNALSNTYNAWKDRVPLLLTFSGGQGEEGKDGFESWDNTLGPTEAFTTWTGRSRTRGRDRHAAPRDQVCLRPAERPSDADLRRGRRDRSRRRFIRSISPPCARGRARPLTSSRSSRSG